jgi:hypothetical protein
LAFPAGDPHWSSTLDQLEAIRSPHGVTLAPAEFLEMLDVYPAQFSFFMHPNDIETLVIHKGRMDEYRQDVLRSFIERAHFASGNAVFCIFPFLAKRLQCIAIQIIST